MPTIITADTDRDRIKNLVPAGNAEAIQTVLDDGTFKRKLYKVAEVDEASHEIVFTVTSDTLDRDSERVLPKSLEKDFGYYKENPVVLFHHDHSIPAVAQMVDHKITDKQVVMRDKFAVDVDYPLAKVLWELYSKGYMRMTSIGFIPIEWTEDEEMMLEGQKGMTFTRIEMIEHSLVNVGANRYALSVSELPAKIRNDSILKTTYESLVESKPITEKSQGTLVTAPTVYIPQGEDGGNPIHITFQVPDGKETHENMALSTKNRCPTCEAKAAASKVASETKGTNLATVLNAAIGDGDDRADTIAMMATAAGIEADTVNQILDGEIDCPPMERLEKFADTLDISVDTLTEAGMQDGCTYEDAMDEEDGMDDDDKAFSASAKSESQAKTKFYGMLSGMFPESYEERQQAIHADLMDYLEYSLEDIEKYEYVEAYPIATYADHVIVYCHNTENLYKAIYTMKDGEVEFTDLKQIKLNYEEIPMDMKDLADKFIDADETSDEASDEESDDDDTDIED